MIYYANGCSYTWGGTLYNFETVDPLTNKKYYLPRDVDCDINLKRLATVYPHHLGKMIKAERVINESLGGGSNHRIVRTTLDYFNSLLIKKQDISNHFVTIQWTEPSRWEFFDQINKTWVLFTNKSFVSETAPEAAHQFKDMTKFYYKNFQSDLQDFHTFLNHVTCLGNFFKLHNIPYLFFGHADFLKAYLDINNFMTRDEYKILLKQFNWFNNDPTKCFMYNFPIQNCMPDGSHPSARGHIQWAEIIYKFICDQQLLNLKVETL